MSEERKWLGALALVWYDKVHPTTAILISRQLSMEGLGPIAEVMPDGIAFVVGQHPDGKGLLMRLPGKGGKRAALNAVTAIYGAEPGLLPTAEEFIGRWQEWMEGSRKASP